MARFNFRMMWVNSFRYLGDMTEDIMARTRWQDAESCHWTATLALIKACRQRNET